jgi:hypothetical protein
MRIFSTVVVSLFLGGLVLGVLSVGILVTAIHNPTGYTRLSTWDSWRIHSIGRDEWIAVTDLRLFGHVQIGRCVLNHRGNETTLLGLSSDDTTSFDLLCAKHEREVPIQPASRAG